MILFYRLIFIPLVLFSLPYYLLRMCRRGGYAKDFSHRFGCFTALPDPKPEIQRIWLQAVSVGEVLAIAPLINALQDRGDIEIVLTTTTSTGYSEARKRYTSSVLFVGIFPIDFWLFSRLAWQRIQPNVIILTESELWPEHLHRAERKGVPTFLINARLSDRSFTRYKRLHPLAKRLLLKIEHIFAASDTDLKRFLELGSEPYRTTCTGNIKFDVAVPSTLSNDEKAALKMALGFDENDLILVGSSTWPGEEETLIKIHQSLLENGTTCSLLLVPRHAERGSEIAELLDAQALPWYRRSSAKPITQKVRIHLADTTGELANLSQIADLVFIGKSLSPNRGGQTPIEAAGLGKPIVMGTNMNNFKAVAHSLVHAGAGQYVANFEELHKKCVALLNDPFTLTKMSNAAQAWHKKNQGSSQRIAESIRVSIKED
ncbi:MAG: 3-deoxy-D-manno-octulosonic acid transferase [Puniceicoccaceae bacterium]|nr:3-deoxy-D-manno-octulosonic acid transferase [Puniceicoccaceae bacterium]